MKSNLSSDKLKKALNASKSKSIKLRNAILLKMLFVGVIFIMVGSLISYLFVLDRESKLQKLHEQVAALKMENVDIKTQVEFARSLYTIQDKAKLFKHLKRPDRVIEVSSTGKNVDLKLEEFPKNIQERIVSGY